MYLFHLEKTQDLPNLVGAVYALQTAKQFMIKRKLLKVAYDFFGAIWCRMLAC